MQVFINECSLNEQLNPYNFIESIKTFTRIIELVNKVNSRSVYRSVMFFNYKAIRGTHIETSLKKDFELNSLFAQNLKSATNWEENQIQDENSSYIFNKEDYVKTSIAEVTERKIINPELKVVLINFVESKFHESRNITVQKNESTNANISCVYDEISILDWLVENGFIDPNAVYDENSGLPPMDKQTILLSDQFELTPWRNGKYGRKVYKLLRSSQLWVIDGSLRHASNRAHIEVFDEETKKHLGTSIYNKIDLNTKYKKKNRTINLI